MSNIKIIHHDECQLLDWGESRSTGPWVKLRLSDVEYLEAFRGLDTATAKKTGHIFNVTITQGDIISEEPKKEHKYGQQAKELRQSSFFRRPEVWRAVGTDQEFLDWLKTECCVAMSVQCHGDIMPMHVRRVANGAGTGIKPEYSAIPGCHFHHSMQHQQGESALYPREWWGKKRIECLVKWCWQKLKEDLGGVSWSDIPPIVLEVWAIEHDISSFLPRCYINSEGS